MAKWSVPSRVPGDRTPVVSNHFVDLTLQFSRGPSGSSAATGCYARTVCGIACCAHSRITLPRLPQGRARDCFLPLPRLFQRFDQEEDFGGHGVVQIRGVGEGAVATTGDNGLEGADEGEEPSGAGTSGESL